MKKILGITVLIGTLMLTACGEEEPDAAEGDVNIELVETVFNSSDSAETGDTMTLSVTVTQGDELVEDADEVVFEVWESGNREESEMLSSKHTGNGVYEAETSFEKEGLFFVQAHTNARGLHVMPKQEMIIGDPDPETIVPDDSSDADSMENMDSHDGH